MNNRKTGACDHMLVQGYMTWRFDGNQKLETHYAGINRALYRTEVKAPTAHFGKHPDGTPGEWRPVSTGVLPDNAEFIGNYPMPPFPT